MNYLRSLEFQTKIRFISEFIVKFSSFLIIPIFTYKIGIKAYGEYVVIICIINGLIPVMLLGLNFSIIKKLAHISSIKINTVKLFSSLSIISLFSFSFFFFFLLITQFFFADFLLINLCICLLTYFTAVQLLLYEFLRSKLKSNLFCYFQIFDSIFLIILILVIDQFLKLNLIKFLSALIIIKFFVITFILFTASKLEMIKLKFLSLDKNLKKNYLYSGVIFIGLGVSEWLINFSDKIILSYFLTPLYLGVYFTAGMFASSLNSLGSVFWWDLFPKFNNLKKKKNYPEIYKIIRKKNMLFIDFSVYIILSLIVLSPLIQSYLLNSKFEINYSIYLIFFLSVFSHQISTGWEFFCYIKNQEKFILFNSMVWGGISFLLYYLVIPYFKIYGALWSLLISKLGYTFSLIIYCKQKGFNGRIIEKKSLIKIGSMIVTFFIFLNIITLSILKFSLVTNSLIYLIIVISMFILISKILQFFIENI